MKPILVNTASRAAALLFVCIGQIACAGTPAQSALPCLADLDFSVVAANKPQTAIVRVALDTREAPRSRARAPVNLAIVLDRSGSMAGEKLEKAKEAAIEAVRRLGRDDILSVVTYDDQIDTIVSGRSAGDVEAIVSQIRAVQPGNSTALYAGVDRGGAELRRNIRGEYVHRLILLSDGLANVGPSSPAEIGALAATLRREGITVSTLGIGNDYSEDVMAEIARRSDGNTYFVETAAELPRIFAGELGEALNVVAKRVVLRFDAGAGVRPLRFLDRAGRVDGYTAEVTINQQFAGEAKYALLEVELPRGPSGSSRSVGRLHCQYEDAADGTRRQATAEAVIRYSSDPDEVTRSANLGVQSNVAMNTVAATAGSALEHADAGREDEAVAVMRQKSTELRQLGGRYGNGNLIQQADDLEVRARRLESEGMTRPMRKGLRSFEWNSDSGGLRP